MGLVMNKVLEKYHSFDKWKCNRLSKEIMTQVLRMELDKTDHWSQPNGVRFALSTFLPSRNIAETFPVMGWLAIRGWFFMLQTDSFGVSYPTIQLRNTLMGHEFHPKDQNPSSLARCICQGIMAVEFSQ